MRQEPQSSPQEQANLERRLPVSGREFCLDCPPSSHPPVILSESEGSLRAASQILRSAQDASMDAPSSTQTPQFLDNPWQSR